MEPHWTANKVLRILTRAWGNGLDFVLSGINLPILPCLQMSLTRFSPHFSFRAAHCSLAWPGLWRPSLNTIVMFPAAFINVFLWFSNNCLFVCENPSRSCASGEAPETSSCWQKWCGFELLLLHVVSRTRGASGITPVPFEGEICRDLTHSKTREAQIKC